MLFFFSIVGRLQYILHSKHFDIVCIWYLFIFGLPNFIFNETLIFIWANFEGSRREKNILQVKL